MSRHARQTVAKRLRRRGEPSAKRLERSGESNAKRLERDLAAFADGSLEGTRRDELLARLQEEPSLAADLAEQRRALEMIRASAKPAPASLHRQVAQLTARRTSRRIDAARLGGTVAAACVIAAALAISFSLSGSSASRPSLDEAVALTMRPAQLPPPAESRTHAGELAMSVDGVAFPYWGTHFHWKSTGSRVDRVSGQVVKTVFYTADNGQRIGYAIVSGAPLRARGGKLERRDGVVYRLLERHRTRVVTWVRDGHSCVVSGHGVSSTMLLRLASWRERAATRS